MVKRFALLSMFCLAAGLAACSADGCSSPEAELRASFVERLQRLEQLRAMSEQDATVIRIAPDFTWLKDDVSWPRPAGRLGFSVARWNEYRRLFEQVGATEGLDRDGASLWLTTRACGLAVSGKSFGYAYLPRRPLTEVLALDALDAEGIGYMPLGGNWYMFVWLSY